MLKIFGFNVALAYKYVLMKFQFDRLIMLKVMKCQSYFGCYIDLFSPIRSQILYNSVVAYLSEINLIE